ncbi:MAG: NADP-dependent malic enzyme [Oscillospiraceae bacterium]|jgi:malate dehydrogenase (oxaloacetate-decarboxylating)|nr:NADP-dependent malic enzyme [Oscillospiraceae bacterium]
MTYTKKIRKGSSSAEDALSLHYLVKGKIEIVSRVPLKSKRDMTLAYTPGVARPCLEIQQNPELSYFLTRRQNLVAVVTDGSAVLGLGDVGGLAGMPVMEGKCCLFKEFAGVDAFPICIKSNDVDEIVRTVELISDGFGGINLEDISAPRCFEIERRLIESLDIPVFHDDQHGTAVVVAAALMNALKLADKKIGNVTAVVNGAGAAGTAITRLLRSMGIGDIILLNSGGILSKDKSYSNAVYAELAEKTNRNNVVGGLAEAMKGADVFIGVSKPNLVTRNMVRSMADKAIVFAMSNPDPEILPADALEAGAFIVGTGRSDFPNQINNVLVFPGIFKGALSVRARKITEEMKIAAAAAIAEKVSDSELCPECIIPSALDKSVAEAVAGAVSGASFSNAAPTGAKGGFI